MKTDQMLVQESPEQLFENNISEVRMLVNRICAGMPQFIDKEELYMIALGNMWKAAKRYNPAIGIKFWLFAIKRVR